MSRRLELRHPYLVPAERIHEVLTDPEYLRDKLREVGGPGAELVSRTEDNGQVTVVQRQAVPENMLPAVVRSFLPGDLNITRTEVWAGPTAGTIDVVVSGAPGSVSGTIAVTPDDPGALVIIRIDASVPVPLVGGMIEQAMIDNIGKLGEIEHAFTREWLSSHPD
ncbi:MAG: DUF2505 domain-containing protein [Actinomycetota bacterium]|nr:DUF2505 domain-containing protein [Actinomycetota bacterium]